MAYRSGFGEESFDALRAIVDRQADSRPFTAYDVLYAAVGTGATEDLCDVEAILCDLEDLGLVRRRPDAPGRPAMWTK